jgi:hypothetical protein
LPNPHEQILFLLLHENIQFSPILSGEAHQVLANVKKFDFEGRSVGRPAYRQLASAP